MKILYIAQSGFIITENNITIALDVWLENPLNPIKISDIPKLNHVFITHDHFDHDMQNGINLALRDNASFHSCKPIAEFAKSRGVDTTFGSNIGDNYVATDIEVTVTNAVHTSDTGFPVGFIIKIGDKTLYHMGDTDYFSEIRDIAILGKIDILFIPIGGTYTMDILDAVKAVNDLQPSKVIPMHYNTFEAIKQDPNEFKDLVKSSSDVVIMNPGETVDV